MRAVAAARSGQIATLVLPADVSWSDGAALAAPRPSLSTSTIDHSQVSTAAHVSSAGPPAMLLLGGNALTERGLRAASRISAATGARLLAETFPARMERGAGVPGVDRLAYLAELAEAQLAGVSHLILAGARAPVSFFAYPGRASDLVPADCSVTVLADSDQDVETALEALAGQVAPETRPVLTELASPPPAEPGPLTAISLANTIAASLPEGAIVSDEANTSGFALPMALTGAARHSLLTLTGGSIGQGLPAATGAAIAAPDRPVLCLEADGSAMYTISALWTHAREGLDITTVIFANGSYAILDLESQRLGVPAGGSAHHDLLDLTRPGLDFIALARGMGVPASRATTTEDFTDQLRRAFAESGPHLIEAAVPPLF